MNEKYTLKDFKEKVLSQCFNISDSALVRNFINSNINNSPRKTPNLTGMFEYEKTTFDIISKIFSKYIIFANPFKYQGHELCDFIAILNNKIFLFSDKGGNSFDNVSLSDHKSIEKKWKNKCNAIKKSEEQLFEAKKWIQQNIKNNMLKIYKDHSCKDMVEFIFRNKPEFFLITTLSGLSNFAKKMYLNNGSLPINMEDIQSNKKILSIPLKKKDLCNKNFVHIVDIEGLRDICEWANTPVDFINYLKFRKKFINNIDFNIKEIKQENNIVYFYVYKNIMNQCYKSAEIEKILTSDQLNCKFNSVSIKNIKGFSEYLDKKENSKLFDNIISHLFYTGKNDDDDDNNENEIQYRNKIYDVLFLSRKERIAISESILFLEKNIKNKTHCKIIKFRNIYIQIIALKINDNEDDHIYCSKIKAYIDKEMKKFSRKKIMQKQNIEKAFFIAIDHPKNHIRINSEYVSVINKDWH